MTPGSPPRPPLPLTPSIPFARSHLSASACSSPHPKHLPCSSSPSRPLPISVPHPQQIELHRSASLPSSLPDPGEFPEVLLQSLAAADPTFSNRSTVLEPPDPLDPASHLEVAGCLQFNLSSSLPWLPSDPWQSELDGTGSGPGSDGPAGRPPLTLLADVYSVELDEILGCLRNVV